jgi:hypothetical protein
VIAEVGFKERTMDRNMQNPCLHDFAALIHVFYNISKGSKRQMYLLKDIHTLIHGRFTDNKDYFTDNKGLISSYRFTKKIVDYYHGLCL